MSFRHRSVLCAFLALALTGLPGCGGGEDDSEAPEFDREAVLPDAPPEPPPVAEETIGLGITMEKRTFVRV